MSMFSQNFCTEYQLQHPLIQAPMAGVQGSALALAVGRAGAMGSLPCAMLSVEQLTQELRLLQAESGRPFNVNFFCHRPPPGSVATPQREAAWRAALAPYYAEYGLDAARIAPGAGRMPFSAALCDVIEPFQPAVVSFHFGLPEAGLLARIKAWGGKVWGNATTLAEAIWLQANGADAIIAQGMEAGGHRGVFLAASADTPGLSAEFPADWRAELSTQQGLLSLLPQIVARVHLPVIAAGGLASPQAVQAAFKLGASAVQVGTAFMLCHEATTSNLHRAALAHAAQHPEQHHTALTTLFTGRPARGMVNRLMRDLGPLHHAAPPFPMATAALAPLRAAAEALGRDDFSPLWSGQNASACKPVAAAHMVEQLMAAPTSQPHCGNS